MNKPIAIALLAAGSIGTAAVATAASGSTLSVEGTVMLDGVGVAQVRSMAIPYDAADVQDPKSAERLFFRIRQAAEEVCRISSHPRGYEMWEEHACEAEAVSEAVEMADLPALDDFHESGANGLLSRVR